MAVNGGHVEDGVALVRHHKLIKPLMPRVLAAEGLARERDVARREQRGHDALAEPEVRAGAIDLVAVKATVFGSVSAQRRTSGVGVWGRGDQWFRTLNIGSPCRVAAGAHPAGQVNACDASSAEPCLMLCGRPSAFSARGSMVVELVELVGSSWSSAARVVGLANFGLLFSISHLCGTSEKIRDDACLNGNFALSVLSASRTSLPPHRGGVISSDR